MNKQDRTIFNTLLKWFLLVFVAAMIFTLCYPVGYFVLKGTRSANLKPFYKHEVSGVGVYIINLDSAKERYVYTTDTIKKLGLPMHRISAIDGRHLSEEDLKELVDFEPYKRFMRAYPRRGEVGCYLSHIKAWQAFLASNYEFALIFEDDISFDPIVLSSTLDKLIKNVDIWDINTFTPQPEGFPIRLKCFSDINRSISVYLGKIKGAAVYILQRKAAYKLLEKALPIKLPVDLYFARGWEFGLKFTGVEPYVAAQTYGDSIIKSTSRTDFINRDNKWLFMRVLYSVQSRIMRVMYNMNVVISNKYKANIP